MFQFGFCCKCSDVKVKKMKPTKSGVIGHEIVGCKKLTATEWKKGVSVDPHWHQSNCPLMETQHE